MKLNNKGFSLIELLVTVGIIGVLSAIGVPLYKAQQTSAVDAVIKSNGFAVQKIIDTKVTLGQTTTRVDLGGNIKVKGAVLPDTCFTILTDGVTTDDIIEVPNETWCVRIANSGTCALDTQFDTCIGWDNSATVIRKDDDDPTGGTSDCVCNSAGTISDGTLITL